MARIPYQLLKNDEPIALGSMTHCLDVFYWEIYYGCDHLAYNIVPFKQNDEVYRKAKAFDEIMKGELGAYYDKAKAYDLLKEDLLINEKVFREQAENDEVSDIIHGHYVALLEQSKLERD